MNLLRTTGAMIALLALGAPAVYAQTATQDTGHVALDIGTTAPLALLLKVNDGFALRPDLTFTHFSVTGDNGWRYGVGLSALGTVSRSGPLTTYLGARGGYIWLSESDAPTDWSVAGIFGARYALAPRFGVAGETGLIYDRLRFSGQPGQDEATLQPWVRLSALLFF
jgi:hypothetical protein